VVASRIDENDKADKADKSEDGGKPPITVVNLIEHLRHGPLAGLRLGLMHGRLPAEEKDAAMAAFRAGEIDVLVCTTVIEVGVDVPNATVMVVMDADRFGVSQLHQLRGRIGRGSHPSLCLLATRMPEPSKAGERLKAVAGTLDGFELADLAHVIKEQNAKPRANEAAHDQNAGQLEINAPATPIGDGAGDGGGCDLRPLRRHRHRCGNAHEDQQRRQQESTANAEHAGNEPDRHPHSQNQEHVDRHFCDGQVDFHAVRASLTLSPTRFR
jgi:superfamily II DNA or RNA helicase